MFYCLRQNCYFHSNIYYYGAAAINWRLFKQKSKALERQLQPAIAHLSRIESAASMPAEFMILRKQRSITAMENPWREFNETLLLVGELITLLIGKS
ncbi:hypothetical protein O9929_17055 [Vibrio lentus]|nr:hypothetical protein [Vibrio lentus]